MVVYGEGIGQGICDVGLAINGGDVRGNGKFESFGGSVGTPAMGSKFFDLVFFI